MKHSIILLEKDGVLIRTKFVDNTNVQWLEGKKPILELTSTGYSVRENKHIEVLKKLENLRDAVCCGHRITNADLLDIIYLLRLYNE